jgi:acetylornithine/N-succinyldiaminopimelate aminotransferase
MVAGTHGSTFGGNPMAMAAGNAVLDTMLEPGFFGRVDRMAKLLRARLETFAQSYPNLFAEVRGAGLLLGIRCVVTAGDFVTRLRQSGLLTLTAGDNVLRILPPLIVGERDIDEALDIMNKVAREWPA